MEEKKVFTIQQEDMRQKKQTRVLTKNKCKTQLKIGLKYYAL